MSVLNKLRLLPLMFTALLLTACGGGGSNPPPPTELAAPAGVSVSVTAIATNHEIAISWNAVAGASSYNLYYAQEPITDIGNYAALNGGTLVPNITATSLTLPEADLTFPSDYYFRLTTNNSAGEGAPSGQVHTFVAVGGINDTGITLCGDYAVPEPVPPTPPTHNNDVDCAVAGATQTAAGADADGDPVPAGQDALYGHQQ